jgi:hypothetical protein
LDGWIVAGLQGFPQSAGRGWIQKMDKWLCWGSMGVSGLLLLLFLLDLFLSMPFGGISKVVDVFGVLASGVVLFLAIDAFRDLR